MEIVFIGAVPSIFSLFSKTVTEFLSLFLEEPIICFYEFFDSSLFRKIIESYPHKKIISYHLELPFSDVKWYYVFDAFIVRSENEYRILTKYVPSKRIRIINNLDSVQLPIFCERCDKVPKIILELLLSSEKTTYTTHKLCEELDCLLFPRKQNITTNISEIITFRDLNKLNISYYDQDDFHIRKAFGWSYVYQMCKSIHSDYAPLWCDFFIEKTFIFETPLLREKSIIPYKNPWIGIAHHTFNETHSIFGRPSSFDRSFTESLKFCKGIICLSETLSREYRKRVNCPVKTIFHPIKFSRETWKNWNGTIVTIGDWYRNPFSLSLLQTNYSKKYLQKYSRVFRVKQKAFENPLFETNTWLRYAYRYLKETHFPVGNFKSFDLHNSRPSSAPERILYDCFEYFLKEIELISFLPEEDYKSLLLNSAIFLNLEDCSASYTVLECISMNIPLIVNRLPALEEYLTKDYPLFYDSLSEISITEDKIIKASQYLSNLDKSRFNIDVFITELLSFKLDIENTK